MKKKKGTKSILTLWLILLTAFALTLVFTPAWAAAPDLDGDGVSNNKDLCPDTPTGEAVDADGCSASQIDSDGDGVNDEADLCPGTLTGDVNEVGCPDLDSDGFYANEDCNDSNSEVNPEETEACDDGIDNNCDGNVDEGCGGGTVDTDGDGYTDAAERAGINLPAGMTLANGTNNLPPCASETDASPLCVHYLVKDLFVIVDRALDCPTSTSCGASCDPLFDTDPSDSGFDSNVPLPSAYPTYSPFDPLAFIAAPQGGGDSGGLGLSVHEILQDSSVSTSQAIAPHFAVRVQENLDPCGSLLGLSTPGLPSPTASSTVWTERIKKWIDGACDSVVIDDNSYHVDICKDAVSGEQVDMNASSPDLSPLYYLFIQNIFNHEIGHLINLATGSEAAGFHLPAASEVVMEQVIGSKATKKQTTVTSILYLSEDFDSASKDGFELY